MNCFTWETTLGRVRVGAPTVFEGLTAFPLFGPLTTERGYLTLEEALAQRTVTVSEVSASGSVPQLALNNKGALPVFLLDGEELVGARQNRVLNLSVLAPARKKLTIPVSCVEAGRWESGKTQFQGGGQVQFATGRSRKLQRVSESMAHGSGHQSDQSELWGDIQGLFDRLGSHSPTRAMADAFEGHASQLDRAVAALPLAFGQTGVAFGHGGKVRGLDLFDSPQTLAGLYPKLVRSWALDTLAQGGKPQPVSAGSLDRFLTRLRLAQAWHQPALGLGEDVRLTDDNLSGAALLGLERVIHIAAFRTG